jgi:hypothetical protein
MRALVFLVIDSARKKANPMPQQKNIDISEHYARFCRPPAAPM